MREMSAGFSVVFEGPATENGQIDVRDLAPALLAMGAIYNAANETLNGERKVQSAVKVQATSAGSFEIALNLWQSLPDMLASMFDFAATHKDGIVAANDLVDLIVKAGAAGGGLLWFLKKLRGRKPDQIKNREDGMVSVHVEGEELVVRPEVINLAENLSVREGVEKFSKVRKRTASRESPSCRARTATMNA